MRTEEQQYYYEIGFREGYIKGSQTGVEQCSRVLESVTRPIIFKIDKDSKYIEGDK